ncbi:MAG TPA: hypothetical protein VEQ85_05395, partial [Lacipirellulaceae bacterium]|nr:hypothetical protein [Lacipirellulaceae bacterium]
GQALPGAEGLFYEGPVGGGSIVVSAMQLAERDLVNWGGFDGFLNGGLLRRPPRRFRDEHEGLVVGLQTVWADSAYADRTRDAHFTTPLRWFSRDAGVAANARFVTPVVPLTPSVPWQGQGQLIPETRLEVDRPGGLGAWDEFNPASQAAREALRTAAGVRVPGASFVVVCLAVYLVILVPLNWMLFKALERVEWAWLAAPVIALAATVAVVRQAQLDIGFVRSQTEIAVLEMQGDLPRGHLSRYTALYSSLSTTYNAEFASQNAVAAPFPVDSARTNAPLQVADAEVLFEKYDQPRLRGIPVTSASTQLLHSEEIVPLSGSLRLSSPPSNPRALQLENATGLALSDAVVVHRFERGGRWALETCWLGRIESGQSHYLPWTPEEPEGDQLIYAAERAKAASVDYRKRLDVNALLKLALKFPPASDPFYGRREEYRLVARIDEPLPGAVTDPAASQTTGTTVVLAHLRYGLPPHPAPDVNSRTDVPTRESPELDAN